MCKSRRRIRLKIFPTLAFSCFLFPSTSTLNVLGFRDAIPKGTSPRALHGTLIPIPDLDTGFVVLKFFLGSSTMRLVSDYLMLVSIPSKKKCVKFYRVHYPHHDHTVKHILKRRKIKTQTKNICELLELSL